LFAQVKGLPKVEKIPVTQDFKPFNLRLAQKPADKPLSSEELALQEC